MISDPNDSTATAHTPTEHDDDDDADVCLCGMNHPNEINLADDDTSDEELPAAIGGIEIHNEEEADDDSDVVDACDIDFAAEDQTTDEELPITVGGI